MRGLWLYVLLFAGAAIVLEASSLGDERVPYARFRELAERGELADVQIDGDAYLGRTQVDPSTGASRVYRTGRIEQVEKDFLATLDEKEIPYTRMADGGRALPLLTWMLPILGGILLLRWLAKQGNSPGIANPVASFGKHRARIYTDRGKTVVFDDVAGSEEAKAELAEIVGFLRAPERFRRLGGRIPRGVLLVGPPGTGKTLLARAVAGEASVPFFHICGSEFVEMFVGVGAARVRDLFSQAREKQAAIVFVDELDAVGKARGAGSALGGNDEREQTLNQLLTEMDGFDAHSGIIVLAATNRPEILDAALLRAGRFDRRIVVDRPDLGERRDILEVHAKKVVLGSDVDLGHLAAQTAGLVGADLANMVNEAALLAARRNADAVAQCDLDEASHRVLAGFERRGRRLRGREKRTVAYHEAGHALMAELLPSQDPVRKISIIPRGYGALGYTLQQPREDKYLLSREEIKDRLVVLLGGRVAEEVTLGDISSGAQDDLANATDLARHMVRELGMGESVGVVSLGARVGFGAERGFGGSPPECSDATAHAVDEEVSRILADAQARARSLMTEHRATLERIATRLLEVETLGAEELGRLLQSIPRKNRSDVSP